MRKDTRCLKLSSKIKAMGIDAAILQKEDARYFLGFETEGVLMIFSDGRSVLLESKLEDNIWGEKLELSKDNIKKLVDGKVIGINYQKTNLGFAKMIRAKTMDINNEIMSIRAVKDKEEIRNIKISCKHADICFQQIIDNFHFSAESEIDKCIRQYALDNNLKLAFEPIVASCANSSIPHYKKNDGNIQKGFLVLDFGFVYKGYCSDMTRTVYVGKPSKQEEDDYAKVLNAQLCSIKMLKENVMYKDVDSCSRNALGKLNKYFIHSLGHGIGLEVHEKPAIFSKSLDIAKNGNVVTIEPGIYKKKYGIRIEDTMLVSKPSIVLTRARKDLVRV